MRTQRSGNESYSQKSNLPPSQMARLNKADLEQMGEEYFRSLEPGRLVEVAKNLHSLAVEQLEKLELSSKNSSRPPSSDNPYRKDSSTESVKESKMLPSTESSSHSLTPKELPESGEKSGSTDPHKAQPKGFGQRKAGKQPGAKGKWTRHRLVPRLGNPSNDRRCGEDFRPG